MTTEVKDLPQNNFLIVGDENSEVINYIREHHVLRDGVSEPSVVDFRVDSKYFVANTRLHSFADLKSVVAWRAKNPTLPASAFGYYMKVCQSSINLDQLEALTSMFRFDSKFVAYRRRLVPVHFLQVLDSWVHSHQFELVELDPNEEERENAEEFHERLSFDRIVEILQTTQWPCEAKPAAEESKTKAWKDFDWEKYNQFEGELDETDKNDLAEIMNGESIIDYYAARGHKFPEEIVDSPPKKATTNGTASTNSVTPPQAPLDPKAAKKKEKKKRQKEKAKAAKSNVQSDLSEDVDIELDKEEVEEKVTEDTESREATADPPEQDSNNYDETKTASNSKTTSPETDLSSRSSDKPESSSQQQHLDAITERCRQTLAKFSHDSADSQAECSFFDELKSIRQELANTPREFRAQMAEMIATSFLQDVMSDDDE